MKREKRAACHVSVYIDEAMKKKAKAKADAEYMPLSAWFRRLIAQAVESRP